MHRLLPYALLLTLLGLGLGACGSGEETTAETPAASPEETTAPAPAPTAEDSADESQVPMVQIKNARMPMPGVLTGGQPNPEQLEAIATAGYKTVVNLRPEDEEGNWDAAPAAGELGLEYVSLPISGGADINVEAAGKLEDLLTNDDLQPMVVHCASGNRVGALFAMHAFHMRRASADDALQIGRDAGMTRLEDTVRELLVQ